LELSDLSSIHSFRSPPRPTLSAPNPKIFLRF
jgi:hypothetical protein